MLTCSTKPRKSETLGERGASGSTIVCWPPMNRQGFDRTVGAVTLAVVLVLALVAIRGAGAQEFRASLLIEVTDSSGGAIPSARVALARRESSTNFEQATD